MHLDSGISQAQWSTARASFDSAEAAASLAYYGTAAQADVAFYQTLSPAYLARDAATQTAGTALQLSLLSANGQHANTLADADLLAMTTTATAQKDRAVSVARAQWVYEIALAHLPADSGEAEAARAAANAEARLVWETAKAVAQWA